jgi:hypothetical protein
MNKVDEVVVQQLATQYMTIAKKHLRAGEQNRNKCFELLNALAVCTAAVIADNDGAQEWFNDALENQIDAMLRLSRDVS